MAINKPKRKRTDQEGNCGPGTVFKFYLAVSNEKSSNCGVRSSTFYLGKSIERHRGQTGRAVKLVTRDWLKPCWYVQVRGDGRYLDIGSGEGKMRPNEEMIKRQN